jgi:hypothetical protein
MFAGLMTSFSRSKADTAFMAQRRDMLQLRDRLRPVATGVSLPFLRPTGIIRERTYCVARDCNVRACESIHKNTADVQ